VETILGALDNRSASALVAAARCGDRDAFADLVEPYLPGALGTARLVTGSAADGADAVQDALLSSWLGLGALRAPEAFGGWFRRQVVRAAMRRSRTRRAVGQLDVELAAPEGELERAVAARQLDRAFDRLEPKDRVVITLRHVLDLPGSEVAEALGVPEGTVKSRLHSAIEHLRAAYEAEERA
jgi:RNA polymerase sigma-70 factor (ECF subfamily)